MWERTKKEPVAGSGNSRFGDLLEGATFIFQGISYRKISEDFAVSVSNGHKVEFGRNTRVFTQ